MHEVNNSHHTRYSRSSRNISISPKKKTNSDKSPPRWYAKRLRGKSYLNDGDATGVGLWYKHKPRHCSIKEYGAPQGHADQVCTADCNHEDQLKCIEEEDDSELESDWLNCTSINPRRYGDQRNMEIELHKKRDKRCKK